MIAVKTIVEQLLDIYYKEEWWHKKKLSPAEAIKYFMHMLDNGNIIYYEENGELLGYCEFWRINFEQWGKIICGVPFSAFEEDVQNGNIAYVANVWIRTDKRMSNVAKILKLMFFKHNYHCDYFVGEARRKRSAPIKVFKKKDLVSRLFEEGRYGKRT